MAEFELSIGKTLAHEGGAKYTNDPNDRGGETKYGISKRSYPDEDIRNLTEERAKELYKRDYWDRVRADDIVDQEIAFSIFDNAVNMGVRTASRLAQSCLNIEPADGFIGNNSLAVINGYKAEDFLVRYALAKVARYVSIVDRDKSQRKYLLGWMHRALGGV